MNSNHFPFSVLIALAGAVLAAVLAVGCGTTTARSGTEQLLLSDAVDMAVSQLDFQHLTGESVYLDSTYIQSTTNDSFVNAPYIHSSLRQQLTASGCLLQENRDDADIIVEPRVGALGSNGHEIIYGLPRNNLLNSAAAIIPNSPAVTIPEISLARVDSNSGVAKVLVFAYDRVTRQPIWQSGVARAEATSRSSWVLGAGPFQRGTLYNGTRFAGQGLKSTNDFALQEPAPGVPFTKPHQFVHPDQITRIAESGEGDEASNSENTNETR